MSTTGKAAVAVLYDWEGNRRPGDALVIRHRLCSICVRAQSRRLRSYRRTAPFTFTLQSIVIFIIIASISSCRRQCRCW